MLRIIAPLFRALGSARAAPLNPGNLNPVKSILPTNYNSNYRCINTASATFVKNTLFSEPLSVKILPALSPTLELPVRTITKFSLTKGKRKSKKDVIKRFFRLHWGGWIRTRAGRHKKLWKKSPALKRRLRQHIFINATQCTLLDKMVTSFWRRPKYYVDDPYEPYHTREEFIFTRKKPTLE